MDSRTAAHALSQIAAYLELKGENSFKCRAYHGAARALRALGADDLAPLYRSGELAGLRGLGPATLAVVRDLVEMGESRYLEQLRESTPEGLLEMLRVPGMTPARIHQVYETLNIQTVEELEQAARDGRLATIPKLGPKTATKILDGIARAREEGDLRLYHHAMIEARQLLAAVEAHPHVARAAIAGALRRRMEVAGHVVIVAECAGDPAAVAQSFTRVAGVRESETSGTRASITFVDGARLDLRCTTGDRFGAAVWRATGSVEHVEQMTTLLERAGYAIDDDLLSFDGSPVPTPKEGDLYGRAGLAPIPPELREGDGEIDAAQHGVVPHLIEPDDIRGALHCHSLYSDGKATVAEMARAAQARGWRYIGITDHSQAAFYAGGLSREQVLSQFDEIDELNERFTDFRILKGIEADILADGRLDYDDDLLDRFDFVVGSIHSRFAMDEATMTARVLRALDDPRLTILAHPTGRLLLNRPPYALDLDAVLQKAAEARVAVELNADPHRLDLDWRHLRRAKALGVTIEIGPDAHSETGLDNMEFGVGAARKGWLTAADVLNARSADAVLQFARARRDSH
ncbi:MAG TPA: DNA polymerase/3'-5' exonuclease PolX [Gemmatimonadaceae bacterium]|nr:DNA polymerase/3'-5' exonuclease PolX [Gemmatimonadaceae bacterium]